MDVNPDVALLVTIFICMAFAFGGIGVGIMPTRTQWFAIGVMVAIVWAHAW